MADEREAYKGTSSEETPIGKSKRPEILAISGRFSMECVIGAVTLEDLHRFFRLRLNDSAPCLLCIIAIDGRIFR